MSDLVENNAQAPFLSIIDKVTAFFPGSEVIAVRLSILSTCSWCGGHDLPHDDCEDNKQHWSRVMSRND